MPGISTGTFKKLFIKRQTGLGVIAPPGAAGSARSMRRVTSTLNKSKASYASAEIVESQQVRDSRHGVVSVGGTLTGELSPGAYQQPIESVLRAAAVAGGTVTATTIAATTDGAGTATGTFTRSAGSFLTDGFKIGDVCNATGFTTTGIPNNDQYFLITGLTATVMKGLTLDKTDFAAKAAGDSVTIGMVAKKVWTPATGQTRDYYTIEHWFGDIGESEVFTDTVFSGANFGLPPSGMTTIEFPMMGIDMVPAQAQYFTAPGAPATGGSLAAVNGVLVIEGAKAGLVTGLTVAVATGHAYPAGDGVVGSNLRPDVLPGTVAVTGQVTILFASAYYRDLFLNEKESSLICALTSDTSAKPGFVAFVMSRVKYNGADKDDSQTGITLTMPYQALENITPLAGNGQPNIQTTLSIQDSAFV